MQCVGGYGYPLDKKFIKNRRKAVYIRGRKGFDRDLAPTAASSGAEPLENPHKKLTNNNKVALAA